MGTAYDAHSAKSLEKTGLARASPDLVCVCPVSGARAHDIVAVHELAQFFRRDLASLHEQVG